MIRMPAEVRSLTIPTTLPLICASSFAPLDEAAARELLSLLRRGCPHGDALTRPCSAARGLFRFAADDMERSVGRD
jgi:hypothetical protein